MMDTEDESGVFDTFQFATLITKAIDTAREVVKPHIVDKEAGYLFPYAVDDDRRIALDSPQKVKNAASFLVSIHQAPRLAGEGDTDGAFGSMFAAGFFCHEVMLAAGLGCPSHEAVESYEKSQSGRKKGASKANEAHSDLHSQYQGLVESKMSEGLSYTEASEAVGAKQGVSGRTVRNHTQNPDTA